MGATGETGATGVAVPSATAFTFASDAGPHVISPVVGTEVTLATATRTVAEGNVLQINLFNFYRMDFNGQQRYERQNSM